MPNQDQTQRSVSGTYRASAPLAENLTHQLIPRRAEHPAYSFFEGGSLSGTAGLQEEMASTSLSAGTGIRLYRLRSLP